MDPNWTVTGNEGIDPNTNFLGTKGPQPLVIRTSNTERMCITIDGNVGIGTTEPRAKLAITGSKATVDVETAEVLRIWRPGVMNVKNSNSAGFFVGAFEPGITGASRLDINVADWPVESNAWGEIPNITVMSLLGNGNVGIGTSNPEAKLEVQGDVKVTGDIVLTNADCAEEFDIEASAEVEPGTVMVLTSEGALQPSRQAYDKRVIGVISGAGDYQPGIILDKQQSSDKRAPIALVGKVYCKVDAQYNPIEIGDLLTTSPTAGYAMKVDDPLKAFGSVIGKALRPLEAGQGVIPIVIASQ